MQKLLTMTVHFEKLQDELRVSYRAVNHSPTTVYLTNHAVRMDPKLGPVPDRSVAFVYFEGLTVHVTKRRPLAPAKLFKPRPHFVTPLAPGQAFDEFFGMGIPISQNHPYEAPPSVTREAMADKVYFSLGYFVDDGFYEPFETTRSDQKVILLRRRAGGAPDAAQEQFLVSEPNALQIPIRVAVGPGSP